MKKEKQKINRNNLKFFKGIALATVLTATIVLTQPVYTVNTLAAAIEDCDLDGYDDHTGNPVPWIGFDSTKGESIPAGWDGHTIYKSKGAFEAAQKSESDAGSNSGTSGSSSSSGSSGGSVSKSDNPKSNSSNGSSSKSNTSKSSTSKSSTPKSSTSKKNTSKGNTSKGNSSKNASDGINSNQTTNEEVTENIEEVTTNSDENNTDKKKSKKSKKVKTKPESTTDASAKETQADLAKVLSDRGTIEVSEVDKSIIHAGSSLVIRGTGFTGNVNDFVIEIHSDNAINLGSVSTLEDGSFEANVYIPEEIEEGEYEVVITYWGEKIAFQTIKVGPKVANTFLKALMVGFSSQNKGLIPGLLILAGLAVVGVVTTIFGGLFGRKKR